MADLRDRPKEKKAPLQSHEYEEDVTLHQFLSQASEKDGNFFIRGYFPNEEVCDLKYKFADEIFVPEHLTKYLDNYLDEIVDILDDGGFGSWVYVSDRKKKENGECN